MTTDFVGEIPSPSATSRWHTMTKNPDGSRTTLDCPGGSCTLNGLDIAPVAGASPLLFPQIDEMTVQNPRRVLAGED